MSTIKNKAYITNKSKAHHVLELGDNLYRVISGTSGQHYTVALNANGATCTCDWAKYRRWSDPRSGCSHVISVYRHIQAEAERQIAVWTEAEAARRQHRPMLNIGDGVTLTLRRR